MSELKTVYNKLFKTELASQKVELALIDDLKKELASLFDGGSKRASEISAIASSLQSAKSVGLSISEKADKASKMAKDLGLDSAQFDFIKNESLNYSKVLDITAKNLIKYNSEL
jgi:hypothetical protein